MSLDPLGLGRRNDPLGINRWTDDPLGIRGGRSSRRRRVPAETELDMLMHQLEPEPRGYLRNVVHNAPGDITEFIRGTKALAGLGIAAVWDNVVRLPFNYATRDQQDIDEITNHYKNAPEAVGGAIMSELERYWNVYGGAASAVVTGDLTRVQPLMEQFEQDPLFTLADVAAFGKIASTPARVGARKLATHAGKEVEENTLRSFINDPQWSELTAQQQIQSYNRLSGFLADQSDELSRATLLDKAANRIELVTNPYKLAWETVGKLPQTRRARELITNRSEAMNIVALNSRMKEDLKISFEHHAKVDLTPWRNLEEVSKQRVMRVGQGLETWDTLTPEEAAGLSALQAVGKRHEPHVIRALMARGDLDETAARTILDNRKMADAIAGESKWQLVNNKATLSDVDRIVYSGLMTLGKTDNLVRNRDKIFARAERLQKKITDSDTPDPNDIATLDRLSLELNLVEQAEAKLLRGDLAFIPGRRDYTMIEALDPKLTSGLGAVQGPGVTKLSVRKIRRKNDIIVDPMAVEPLMLRYVDFMAHTQGQLSLVDDIVATSLKVKTDDFAQILLDNGATAIKGDANGFELVGMPNGSKAWLPKGMSDIFKKALSPDRPGKFLSTLDFTRNEFSKVVLGMNPGWVAYNVIGNTMLYGLLGGSPTKLAKALGYRTASTLDSIFKEKGWNPGTIGPMVEKLAKEWREIVPKSQALGYTSAETRRFGTVEYYTQGEIVWGQSSVAKWAKRYSEEGLFKIKGVPVSTKTAATPLSTFNEWVEEIYRGAAWLTVEDRMIAARQFGETGKVLLGMNSNREAMKRLTSEFDPNRLTKPGGVYGNLSREAKMTMDTVNKFFNDYYRLGPMERSVMRRVLPFYSWTKFVNKLALELPVNHPIRLSIAMFTTNAVQDARTVDDKLPDWLQDATMVTKHADGTATFHSGGASIFEGVLFGDEGFSKLPMGLNPVFKMPLEMMMGVNFMRQGTTRVAPSRAVAGVTQQYGRGGALKLNADGQLEEITPRPSIPLALVRSGLIPIPAWRNIEKSIRGGPHDDIGSMAELGWELGRILTGEPRHYPGAFIEKETQRPYEQGGKSELFGSGFGISRYTIDYQSIREREIERRLASARQIAKQRAEGVEPPSSLEDALSGFF